MSQKATDNKEFDIDVKRLLEKLVSKAWLIMTVAIIGAALTLVVTACFITPMYQSSAMFYVNNSSFSVGDASISIDSGDISASKSLVNSYIVILKTRESLNDVIDYAGVDRNYKELRDMISAASVNSTEIFEVVVTSPDPAEAEQIANAIAYILPKRISGIIEGTSAKVVDNAVAPGGPSSPSYLKNTVMGFLMSFLLAACMVALREIFDISIQNEEDIAQCCSHPVLTSVPDLTVAKKGYGYERKRKDAKSKQPVLVGSGISFAAEEAYKLLRTKLQFSFADESTCHVIGVCSALSGEGKSLTSVNLAYTLSQLNKKVLLMDCDMRRPTLAEKLKIRKKPGLSSFLTGQIGITELIHRCSLTEDGAAFHAIAAGENPPNPVELLSSARMEMALRAQRQVYDYIILDLPPISEVTDALALADKLDGLLLVVRKDHCNKVVLSEAVQQFKFVNTKVLGVVFNCATKNGEGYRKSYYKKYGN